MSLSVDGDPDTFRRCWPEVLAATVRVTRDLDLAEDCVQDALVRLLETPQAPDQVLAWLITTARRIAIDRLRRQATLRRKLPLLAVEEPTANDGPDLLRLVFTCAHPALSQPAQLVLTLRLIGGLTVPEISAGLLIKEATVAARITRSKQKIATARLPFRIPAGPELPERLDMALNVIHLIHTAGHTNPSDGNAVRPDLAAKARELAALLSRLMPDHPEVLGLRARCLLDDARAPARTGLGSVLLLDQQDRNQWDWPMSNRGLQLATRSLAATAPGSSPGRFALQAAIAGLHSVAPDYESTDWATIVTMYDGLIAAWPTPVVALNRLAARSLVPDADLPEILLELDLLAGDATLRDYQYLRSTRADVLRRMGRSVDAKAEYRGALAIARNAAERALLQRRIRECGA